MDRMHTMDRRKGVIERDSCYFCTSTFQIFAILSLACERKENSDLYIDPQFSDAELFAKRIEDTGIFDSVKLIDSDSIYKKYMSYGPGVKNHLQIANSYLHVEDIARNILIENVAYKHLFLSSKAYLPRMVQLYYLKSKRLFTTFYFDDGTGSYGQERAYRIKFTDKCLRWILFGKKAISIKNDRYVFSPCLYSALNEKQDFEVRPIKRVWEDVKGKELINKVFGIINKPEIRERAIILDQPKDELFSRDDAQILNGIYKDIAQVIGFNNTVIKKHPRSSAEEYIGIKEFQNTGIPFEVYCLNSEMNKKIIISYSSTAVATPKVLFDQEPIVIVLCKLIKTIKGEKNLFEDYFQAVQSTYRDPKRFYIPEDVESLNTILQKLN